MSSSKSKGTTTRSCRGRGSRGRGNRRYALRGSVRETSSSWCGTAPRAKPIGISIVVSFSRCSRQGSRSGGFEARDLGRIEPRYSRGTHTPFSGWPTNSAAKVVGGIGGQWTASVGHFPPAPNLATHVPWHRSQDTLRDPNPLRDHEPDVATQRTKPKNSRAGRRLACVHLLTGRGEQELITRELRHEKRLRKFLDEGRAPWRKESDAKGKSQEKGKQGK